MFYGYSKLHQNIILWLFPGKFNLQRCYPLVKDPSLHLTVFNICARKRSRSDYLNHIHKIVVGIEHCRGIFPSKSYKPNMCSAHLRSRFRRFYFKLGSRFLFKWKSWDLARDKLYHLDNLCNRGHRMKSAMWRQELNFNCFRW